MPRPDSQPNLVFIVADQWRGDCLGVAQSRHPVMTPHLDQIAAEGVHFRQAYADCPVCMPQRATMLTGQTATRFGMPHNFMGGSGRTPVDRLTSLPGRLTREAGYQTKAVGKMHFEPERGRFGFEHIALHPNDYVNWLEEQGYGGMYRGHGLGGNEVTPAVSAVPEPFTHTHWIVDESIRFLYQRDPEAPFFLWMVFEAPHSPFDPPEPFDRMYDQFTIPEPVMGDWFESDTYPPAFAERRLTHKYDRLSPEVIRAARRHYYGQITHIDYQLARFFGELKRQGLYNNTAIVFTADHGEHLGDHGLFGKYDFLQSACRVPFVMRFPTGTPIAHPDLLLDAPVMTADICPTLLELAGLRPSGGMDGMSLLPLIASGEAEEDRIICGETNQSAFATDGHHKYVYHARGGIEQLFDVQNDPDDEHDLAQHSDHQLIRQELRQELITTLSRFDRPLVKNGKLVSRNVEIDEHHARAGNPAAWRGPLRYGQGY